MFKHILISYTILSSQINISTASAVELYREVLEFVNPSINQCQNIQKGSTFDNTWARGQAEYTNVEDFVDYQLFQDRAAQILKKCYTSGSQADVSSLQMTRNSLYQCLTSSTGYLFNLVESVYPETVQLILQKFIDSLYDCECIEEFEEDTAKIEMVKVCDYQTLDLPSLVDRLIFDATAATWKIMGHHNKQETLNQDQLYDRIMFLNDSMGFRSWMIKLVLRPMVAKQAKNALKFYDVNQDEVLDFQELFRVFSEEWFDSFVISFD